VDVHIDSKEDNQFHLEIPFEAQTLRVEVALDDQTQTMEHIAGSVRALNKNIDQVNFFTLDGAVIPSIEILKHRNNIPFIMSMTRVGSPVKWNYAINLNEGFSISSAQGHSHRSKASEEAYLEYCLGIGLPKYSSFVLANFASKLHHTLPQRQ
jgi:hypothetical protein